MNTVRLHAHDQLKIQRSVARPVPVFSVKDKTVFGAFANTDHFSLAALKKAYTQNQVEAVPLSRR